MPEMDEVLKASDITPSMIDAGKQAYTDWQQGRYYDLSLPEAIYTAMHNARTPAPSSLPDVGEMVRLFPEAFDVLTRQEMKDVKGNWRSLIDQQTAALRKLRAATDGSEDE